MAIGTDYLQADGPVSPVQHYWSLSIEEQFYAVWPLLLLLLAFVLKTRRELTIVVIFGLLGSIVVAARLTSGDPTPAYFNTFARCWELLAGALVAIVGVAGPRVSTRIRALLASVGLVIIVVSAIVVADTWAVPFPWVAPSVLGSALVIWASAPAGRWSLLGNPVAQWLGNISYSLYLWHFPVLIFGESLIGGSPWAIVGLIAIMLLMSHLSYHFVELPIMRSSFLRKAGKIRNKRPFTMRDVAVGAVTLIAIVILGVAQIHGPGSLRSGSSFTTKFLERQPFTATDLTPSVAEREAQVQQATGARSWPDSVSFEMTWLDAAKLPSSMKTISPGCRNFTTSSAPPLVCDLAQGNNGSAMLMGDSVAISWAPAVSHVAESRGWSLTGVGYTNCSLIDVDARNNANTPGFAEQCEKRRQTMFDMIAKEKPDAVFLSASETVMEYMDLPAREAQAEWQAGVERTLDKLRDVPAVYILTNPPLTENPLECANKIVGPTSCQTDVSEQFKAKTAAYHDAAGTFSHVKVIDTESWFCFDDQCPVYVGDHIVKTDTAHLTAVSGKVLGPVLLDALTAANNS